MTRNDTTQRHDGQNAWDRECRATTALVLIALAALGIMAGAWLLGVMMDRDHEQRARTGREMYERTQ